MSSVVIDIVFIITATSHKLQSLRPQFWCSFPCNERKTTQESN